MQTSQVQGPRMSLNTTSSVNQESALSAAGYGPNQMIKQLQERKLNSWATEITQQARYIICKEAEFEPRHCIIPQELWGVTLSTEV